MNLLAANINWPNQNCSGSGIYAGRMGALESFVSQSPTTKILIAKVPTALPDESTSNRSPELELVDNNIPTEKLPKYETFEIVNEISLFDDVLEDPEIFYDRKLLQDDMTVFSVEFLDFSTQQSQRGKVCNDGFCCHYDIDVSDNGPKDGKVFSVWF